MEWENETRQSNGMEAMLGVPTRCQVPRIQNTVVDKNLMSAFIEAGRRDVGVTFNTTDNLCLVDF